jgi:hypothetical protein
MHIRGVIVSLSLSAALCFPLAQPDYGIDVPASTGESSLDSISILEKSILLDGGRDEFAGCTRTSSLEVNVC